MRVSERAFRNIAIAIGMVLFVTTIYFARTRLARDARRELPDDPQVLATPAAATSGRGNIAVYFSPGGGCTDAIVAEINSAKETLDVQAYTFTSTPIASAVKTAFERGVKVRVLLDKSQRTESYSAATYLYNGKVPVWIDDRHAIAHNKVMLIDGKTIITGSFNFTQAAERDNAENLLIIHDEPKLFSAYSNNFAEHLAHSHEYENSSGWQLGIP
jgi:phosphatidylserine/phosphatidylglycerophosphate/cardiolipin synthase-like enzyme